MGQKFQQETISAPTVPCHTHSDAPRAPQNRWDVEGKAEVERNVQSWATGFVRRLLGNAGERDSQVPASVELMFQRGREARKNKRTRGGHRAVLQKKQKATAGLQRAVFADTGRWEVSREKTGGATPGRRSSTCKGGRAVRGREKGEQPSLAWTQFPLEKQRSCVSVSVAVMRIQ